jgi:transposase-like protein
MEAFLQQGIHSSEQPLSQFIRLAVQNMVQQAIEQEMTDFLGRDRYERQPEANGYRNGYKPGRIRSAEGEIPLAVPQVRGSAEPYRSKLLAFLRGNSDVLEYLVVQMYSRGLSTRDVEEAFRDPHTGEMLLSRTAVSQITDSLWEDYQAFCQRDLSDFAVEYLFLDAVYERLRRVGNTKEALLCAWGICRDGRKVLLHLATRSKSPCAPSGMRPIEPPLTCWSRISSSVSVANYPRLPPACRMIWKPVSAFCAARPCISSAFARLT